MLFHVSEEAGITRFEPRPSERSTDPVVWAIDAEHLRNYLLPRDCPRVTYYATPHTTPEDVTRFLGTSTAVVAVEDSWLGRLRSCRLYCYALPPGTFIPQDRGAGYFVSSVAVAPVSVEVVEDSVAALERRGAELRGLPSLWPLHDAVIVSSLQFSMIRMGNAQPRVEP